MYVLEGEIDYFFKNLEDNDIKYLKVKQGDTIYTLPNYMQHISQLKHP